MADRDAAGKLRIYHTIYRLNLSFTNIVEHCTALRGYGVFTAKFTRLYQSYAQELQAEINQDVLETLDRIATYLYVDGSRYWYSTQPSVNRMAEERAERLHPEDVAEEIRIRLIEEAKHRGDFSKVHPCPASHNEVVDEPEAKLVMLGPNHLHSAKDTDSPARQLAADILNRGSAGRNCGNMLVFLAADKARFVDLDKAVRLYLAWKSIEKEKVPLDLTPFQANQVDQKKLGSDQAVKGRIHETYVWLLVPGQKRPESGQAFPDVEWQDIRLQGQEALAERASKKLKNEELLITSMAGTRLHLEITQIPLWRGNHVGVKQLVDDFAKYLYLPRVKNAQVILDAIQDGAARLTWKRDTFAYADSYDVSANRYRGLEAGRRVTVQLNSESVVVKPDVASEQIEGESADASPGSSTGVSTASLTASGTPESVRGGDSPTTTQIGLPKTGALRRFHGSVALNPTRLSRDADVIATSVVQHLTGLLDAKVKITIEIEAEIPSGAPENVVRTVTENCRTLKFDNQGFEEA